jgi:hypothetical protein
MRMVASLRWLQCSADCTRQPATGRPSAEAEGLSCSRVGMVELSSDADTLAPATKYALHRSQQVLHDPA